MKKDLFEQLFRRDFSVRITGPKISDDPIGQGEGKSPDKGPQDTKKRYVFGKKLEFGYPVLSLIDRYFRVGYIGITC